MKLLGSKIYNLIKIYIFLIILCFFTQYYTYTVLHANFAPDFFLYNIINYYNNINSNNNTSKK